jgi:two-component system, response regulator RegA
MVGKRQYISMALLFRVFLLLCIFVCANWYYEVLGAALERRGFAVRITHDVAEAMVLAEQADPAYAIVDLVMPRASGLELVATLCARDARIKVVVLTGYASIATAVEAIKLGATHYLTKPADAHEIVAAFNRSKGDPKTAVTSTPIPVERLEWEHIQRVMLECGGNISAGGRPSAWDVPSHLAAQDQETFACTLAMAPGPRLGPGRTLRSEPLSQPAYPWRTELFPTSLARPTSIVVK